MDIKQATELPPVDVHTGPYDTQENAELDRLVWVLRNRQNIVVIAGAGVSTSANIPAWRTPEGVFNSTSANGTRLRNLFEAPIYSSSWKNAAALHEHVAHTVYLSATNTPTDFHYMVGAIADRGRLRRLYTQNIDCLDLRVDGLATNAPLRQTSQGEWPNTIQLHGSAFKSRCSQCLAFLHWPPMIDFILGLPKECGICKERQNHPLATGRTPHRTCGYYRPRITLYGEAGLDDDAIGEVQDADVACGLVDAVVVVGTTLNVAALKGFVSDLGDGMRRRGVGEMIWLNPSSRNPPPIAPGWDQHARVPADLVAQSSLLGFFRP